MSPRVPSFALAGILAAIVVPTEAHASAKYAVPCLKAGGKSVHAAVKPKTCAVADEYAQEPVLITIRRITWKRWGKRADATGKVKGAAYAGTVRLRASKPKRCHAKLTIYTKLVVEIPKQGPIALVSSGCPKK